MRKKKISTEEEVSYKLSVLIDDETKKLVDLASKNANMTYTKFVRQMIHRICGPSPEVRMSISDCLIKQIQKIDNQLYTVGPVERSGLLALKQEYLDIYQLFNVEGDSNTVGLKGSPTTTAKIKDGDIVSFPSRWLIANPEEAALFCYAGVIESNMVDLPHIVFFSNENDNYSDAFQRRIINICYEKWPDLKTAMATAKIRFFPLYDKNNCPPSYEFPYGACIIRKNEMKNL